MYDAIYDFAQHKGAFGTEVLGGVWSLRPTEAAGYPATPGGAGQSPPPTRTPGVPICGPM